MGAVSRFMAMEKENMKLVVVREDACGPGLMVPDDWLWPILGGNCPKKRRILSSMSTEVADILYKYIK